MLISDSLGLALTENVREGKKRKCDVGLWTHDENTIRVSLAQVQASQQMFLATGSRL